MEQNHAQETFFFDSERLSLCGPHGKRVVLRLLGAAVDQVLWPDADKKIKNIALYSRNWSDYAGATLGPVANRLAGACLPVGDNVLSLSANDGANTLHGGTHGLSLRRWALTAGGGGGSAAWAELSCTLPHGLDGFPGERRFTVRYALTGDGITLQYTAETDRPTLVSMSNHTYWNLTGNFSGDCYDQLLEIGAREVLYNDAAHIPFAPRLCAGTAFDFSAPVSLREAMGRTAACALAPLDSDAGQLRNARGYNNGFTLSPAAPFAARLTNPGDGLRMTLTTDQPYLVLYSGGYLSTPGCALALEAQGRPGAVTPLLDAGRVYRRFIRFSFDYA